VKIARPEVVEAHAHFGEVGVVVQDPARGNLRGEVEATRGSLCSYQILYAFPGTFFSMSPTRAGRLSDCIEKTWFGFYYWKL